MVRRVRSEDDGYLNLINDPIWSGQGDVFELYAAIEAGIVPETINVQVSPDCGDDPELNFVGYGLIDIVAGPSIDTRMVHLLEASCYRVDLRSGSRSYAAYVPRQFYNAFDAENSVFERFDNERRTISNL